MLRSVDKQLRESMESVSKKKKGYGGKDLHKRKVLSLEWKSEKVMDAKNPSAALTTHVYLDLDKIADFVKVTWKTT